MEQYKVYGGIEELSVNQQNLLDYELEISGLDDMNPHDFVQIGQIIERISRINSVEDIVVWYSDERDCDVRTVAGAIEIFLLDNLMEE